MEGTGAGLPAHPTLDVTGAPSSTALLTALREAQDEYKLLVLSWKSRKIGMQGYIEAEPEAAGRVAQAQARVNALHHVAPELDALKRAMAEYPELGAAAVLREKLPLPTQRDVIRLLLRVRVDRGIRGRRLPASQRVRVELADCGDDL